MIGNLMYKVCLRTLSQNDYPKDMFIRIKTFYNTNLITEEEYQELIKILDNKQK